jgi:hypothetical protein
MLCCKTYQKSRSKLTLALLEIGWNDHCHDGGEALRRKLAIDSKSNKLKGKAENMHREESACLGRKSRKKLVRNETCWTEPSQTAASYAKYFMDTIQYFSILAMPTRFNTHFDAGICVNCTVHPRKQTALVIVNYNAGIPTLRQQRNSKEISHDSF